jgi:hypothetical protein
MRRRWWPRLNASIENEKRLRELLALYDPLGVDDRTDEYIIIASVILGRLKDVSTIDDLETLLDESVGTWVDEDTPEQTRQCANVARDFWNPTET